jgi:predicted DNA-binding protein (UPF0251 family)
MPRPLKPRSINFEPLNISFIPQMVSIPSANQVRLTVDELEALRLADLNGLSHETAAGEMDVSRATFGRIVARARGKVADALVHGRNIGIEGGVVKFNPPYGRAWRGGSRGPHGHGKGPWH